MNPRREIALISLEKVDGDKVSFVEIFKYEGMEVRISYSGQVTSADEIKSRGR